MAFLLFFQFFQKSLFLYLNVVYIEFYKTQIA